MLSIITINFNNSIGLLKTAQSIKEQTTSEYEWIVIDGGSTDDSIKTIQRFTDIITYWISEPDNGIYHAMNKGIKIAKGDYLQFLNSGDYLANNKTIEDFYNENFTDDVIYGNAIIVKNNNLEVNRFIAPEFVTLSYFFNHTLNHQATFFHKRCFNNYLYNEKNRIASDVELYMKLLYNFFSFKKWNKFIVYYDNTGISSQKSKNEFTQIVDNVLPEGIKVDYEDFIRFRDVDLAIIIKKIINSNKITRHIARVLLYPLYYLIK